MFWNRGWPAAVQTAGERKSAINVTHARDAGAPVSRSGLPATFRIPPGRRSSPNPGEARPDGRASSCHPPRIESRVFGSLGATPAPNRCARAATHFPAPRSGDADSFLPVPATVSFPDWRTSVLAKADHLAYTRPHSTRNAGRAPSSRALRPGCRQITSLNGCRQPPTARHV